MGNSRAHRARLPPVASSEECASRSSAGRGPSSQPSSATAAIEPHQQSTCCHGHGHGHRRQRVTVQLLSFVRGTLDVSDKGLVLAQGPPSCARLTV